EERGYVARFPLWKAAGASVVRRIARLFAATYRVGIQFQIERHYRRAPVVGLAKRSNAAGHNFRSVFPECASARHGPCIRIDDGAAFPRRRTFPKGRVGSYRRPAD